MAELFSNAAVRIERHVSGALSNNAYLIVCARSGASVAVDAPAGAAALVEAARRTSVCALLITHGHWDHVEGLDHVAEGLGGVPVWLGEADRAGLERCQWLEPQDGRMRFGELWLEFIATPGHTPGSTCFLLPAEAAGGSGFLFAGDTLFPGGPGRTGTHADFKLILASIEGSLLTLPPSTAVLPGHGEATDVGAARAEHAAFMEMPLTGHERGDVAWSRQ